MNPIDLVQRYFDAWNAHDADAIVATFGKTGSYTDPSTGGPLSGSAIADYARTLWSGFSELKFEIRSVVPANENRIIAEWTMNGVNDGSFAGLPPTGLPVSLPGIDVIDIGANAIEAVTGYYDSRTVPEQLGLEVLVQPERIGPFAFGDAVTVQSENRAKPGAFSITSIWNELDQQADIRALSRETAREMLGMEGFIGLALVRVGRRGITISAWERPEHAEQIRQSTAHREAMRRFWGELGTAAFTSVWTPDHINPFWVRCDACGKMNDVEKSDGHCGCGETLPEAPAWF